MHIVGFENFELLVEQGMMPPDYMHMRLRWTIKPGNDLLIVWNRGWKRLILSRDDLNLIPESELLAVKLRWTFRR